jgi:phage RecT family recombinase
MSKAQLVNVNQIVKMVRPEFDALARIHGAVNFVEEASFAMQILTDNDYLASVAVGNPDSLKRAVINVAAIGLSLNPYKREAYLLPRKKKVCLDISYVGYVKLAILSGGIISAVAELVRAKDFFEWKGIDVKPTHQFTPFDDRGRVIGGYVQAMTPDYRYIMTHLSIDEIEKIRNRSESWKAGGKSPWTTDPDEMAKKTLIRNGRKSWPVVDNPRFDRAREIMEEADPILLGPAPEIENVERNEVILQIRGALEILERSEEKAIAHFTRVHRRALKSLSDMTLSELKQSLISLSQMVDQKNEKDNNL